MMFLKKYDHILVSIIVPIHNSQRYLDRCIKSIVEQTHNNIEILLIDDGSTDESSYVCEQWVKIEKRIKYYRKDNEGLGPTRNYGLLKSQADFCCSVDADDYVDNRYVETLLEAAIEEDADVTVCNYYSFKGTEQDVITGCKYATGNRIIETIEEKRRYLRGIPRTSFWGKLYRRSLLVDNKLFQPNTTAQDAAVLTQIVAAAKRIITIPDMLYYYRTDNATSITATRNKLNDFGKIVTYSVEEMKRLGLYERYRFEQASFFSFHASCMLKRYSPEESRDTDFASVIRILDECFTGWGKGIRKRWIVYGSFNAEWTAQICSGSILCSKEKIIFSNLISQFLGEIAKGTIHVLHNNLIRKKMMENDFFSVMKSISLDDVDGVMIDFSSEPRDVLITEDGVLLTDSEAFREICKFDIRIRERITVGSDKYMRLWRLACNKFITWLNNQKQIPVYLLHMELPNRDDKNRIIKLMENYFVEMNPRCHYIVSDKILYYTQHSHPFGNQPENMNWDLYRDMASKICDWKSIRRD